MLRIVYQDEHLVAIDKPAGLLVHRTGLDAHERQFALQLLRRQVKRRLYPVHRLDKGTSGVLLFALDREAAAALGGMLARQELAKTYLAVVRGHPPEAGEIDHPLRRRRDETDSPGAVGSTEPREAKTRYRRLAAIELPHRVDRYPTSRYALVELHPLRGARISFAGTSATSPTPSSAIRPSAAAGTTDSSGACWDATASCWPAWRSGWLTPSPAPP